MDCPHCGEDTDPTLLYCKVCGEALELDEEQVAKSMERDTELEAIEEMEIQSRGALYLSLFILVTIIAVRTIGLRPVNAEVSPGYWANAKVLDANGVEPSKALELEPAAIEIPNEKRDNRGVETPGKKDPKKDDKPPPPPATTNNKPK